MPDRSTTAPPTTATGASPGSARSAYGSGTGPSGDTAETRLVRLRELVAGARAMPMSASCVINRGEVLGAIDDVIANLPDEIAGAQEVIDAARAKVAEGEAEAERIVAEARTRAGELAGHDEVVEIARQRAAAIVADAETEARELRQEADRFVDSRMATFESVLHKTTSQVRTARARLAERSGLDVHAGSPAGTPAAGIDDTRA